MQKNNFTFQEIVSLLILGLLQWKQPEFFRQLLLQAAVYEKYNIQSQQAAQTTQRHCFTQEKVEPLGNFWYWILETTIEKERARYWP